MRFKTLIAAALAAAVCVPAALADDRPRPGDKERERMEEAKKKAEEKRAELRERMEEAKKKADEKRDQMRERMEEAKKKAEERKRERAEARKERKSERKLSCRPFEAKGEVADVGGSGFALAVKQSNIQALRGKTLRVMVADATKFRGAAGLDELAEGDMVIVVGKACAKGDDHLFMAAKVGVKSDAPAAEEESGGDDAGSDGE